MAEQVYRTSTDAVLHELSAVVNPRKANPSSLPIGPSSLSVLLRDAIIMVEVRGVMTPYSVHIDDARAVVVDVYRRLTPTERFRLHSALHSTINYVPGWVQEIVS